MSNIVTKYKKDILGISWMAGAGLLFLMLVSYDSQDPSFSSSGRVHAVNYCGYFGSFLSDLLFQIFGLTAWFFVAVATHQSIQAFRGQPLRSSWARIICGAGLFVTIASLVGLYFPEMRLYQRTIPMGGLLGLAVSRALVALFNPAGVAIILWSLALVFLVIYTERTLKENFRFPLALAGHSKKLIVPLVKQFEMKSGPVEPSPEVKNPPLIESTLAKLTFFKKTNLIEEPEPVLSKSLSGVESRQIEEASDEDEIDTAAGFILERMPAKLFKRETPKVPAKVRRTVENWELPKVSILAEPPATRNTIDSKTIKKNVETLEDKLNQFSVKGKVVAVKPGPAVTMYEFKPNADVKISKITELADDLALALSSESLRIIAPMPGRDVVGIETSNPARDTVYMRESLEDVAFWDDKIKLPTVLGKQANGESRIEDLRKMPHLLVAGSTGSGKSVFVTSLLTGLLFRHSPKTLRLIIVDPKQVDLAAFHKIPHLIMPPVKEARKAVQALKWAIREMEKRYRSMSKFEARGLEGFNETVAKLSSSSLEEHTKINEEFEIQNQKINTYYFNPLPYIVIIVEEFGDLMAVDKLNVEQAVVRLSQMARACGIHLVLAMQSPRKDVVTGLIKTNIPGRISFKVASKTDSRIILDESGAERLLARGDMLFLAPGVSKPQRHHAAWLSEDEIGAVAQFWSNQAEPEYDKLALKVLDSSVSDGEGAGGDATAAFDDETSSEFDERYDEIIAWIASQKEVSASLLQRRFKLGYPRAARLIEIFEQQGAVGPANGSKPRQVLINKL